MRMRGEALELALRVVLSCPCPVTAEQEAGVFEIPQRLLDLRPSALAHDPAGVGDGGRGRDAAGALPVRRWGGGLRQHLPAAQVRSVRRGALGVPPWDRGEPVERRRGRAGLASQRGQRPARAASPPRLSRGLRWSLSVTARRRYSSDHLACRPPIGMRTSLSRGRRSQGTSPRRRDGDVPSIPSLLGR